MATTRNLQLKSPRANLPFSAAAPSAGSANLAMLALDDLGVIRDCSQACETMFGYPQDELTGSHISMLLPQLGETELVLEDRINARLAYLCHCAVAFQARHRDGGAFLSELFINRLDSHNVVVLVRGLEAAAANVVALIPRPNR